MALRAERLHCPVSFDVLRFYLKVVVRAEILPRDFLQTLGNYYLSLTIAKIHRLKNKKFRQFLKL